MSANSATTIRKNEEAVQDSTAYVADENHMAIYEEAKAIEAQIEALKKAKAELLKPIRQDMEVLEVKKIVGVDNSTLFTLTTAPRTTIDMKSLKEDLPGVEDEYGVTKDVTTFKMY